MKTSDFNYRLPPELIAQTPIEPRDSSRLMLVNRATGAIEHYHFNDITSLLHAGDVLVMNNSRVIPARLLGRKTDSAGKVELLLLRRMGDGAWEVLARPGKRLQAGAKIEITARDSRVKPKVIAEVKATLPDGIRLVHFSNQSLLPELGQVPLPPYIHTPLANPERYQTVYAKDAGSAAAPTAGLHFTTKLLAELKNEGIDCLYTTLHIGLDTFRPVQTEDPTRHPIHREYGTVNPEVAYRLSQARIEGRRIVCVGTTSVRLLEYAAQRSHSAILKPFEGWVDLLILPGHRFRMVDALVTNFHLPCSTLLMLVSAFAGADLIKKAYDKAIKERYRFYSFGDAMLIV